MLRLHTGVAADVSGSLMRKSDCLHINSPDRLKCVVYKDPGNTLYGYINMVELSQDWCILPQTLQTPQSDIVAVKTEPAAEQLGLAQSLVAEARWRSGRHAGRGTILQVLRHPPLRHSCFLFVVHQLSLR